MIPIACTLGIIVLCLLSAFWRNALRQRRLIIDALLAHVARQREENQRQLQWIVTERMRLKEE